MNEPKFTPGPWYPPHLSTATDSDKCRCRSIVDEGYAGGIATIHLWNGIESIRAGGNDAPPEEEARANGFLIATSPELYARLKISNAMLRTLVPKDISVREMTARNDEVLAKARGEGEWS